MVQCTAHPSTLTTLCCCLPLRTLLVHCLCLAVCPSVCVSGFCLFVFLCDCVFTVFLLCGIHSQVVEFADFYHFSLFQRSQLPSVGCGIQVSTHSLVKRVVRAVLLTCSPMGFYFVSCSNDCTARLWSTDHVQPLRVFANHCCDVDVLTHSHLPLSIQSHLNCVYRCASSIPMVITLPLALLIGV